ncbi:MAG: SDR family oxidoreductase [bacterium]|nr:SDR family oxidoreductase [bacterium]
MRILVTGGAGFVGSHLCDQLLSEDHEVVAVDCLITGSEENIQHLYSNPRFKFIKHDIIAPFFLDEVIDQVYNLACPASPIHYQANSVRTIKVNTVGVINILGFAREHGARILQASTSEVYGDPKISPQNEEYRGEVSTIGPRACYDEGKRCAETLFFDYRRMHGMEIKVARIFNTYGPRMAFEDGRVVSNFITQALKNEPITIYGDGMQTRSFCYVSDLVDGLIKLMNSDGSITGPINLGNPQENTVKELAELIIKLTGSTSQLVYNELPMDDPQQRCPDITKATKILGWKPAVNWKEGLETTIADFRARLSL